ncbi:diguanylate cyclase domain-containing protein [Blastococcus deserti]|uniref:Diguanylate cyclase domain-containing protein n=1 Tax=Blastococcus deserti TaxID=2259033 RepID=A0ABW4X612_9ACTN
MTTADAGRRPEGAEPEPPATAARAWGHASVAAAVVVLMATVVPAGVARSATEIMLFGLGLAAVSCALNRHRVISAFAWRGLAATLALFAVSTAAEIPPNLGIGSGTFARIESWLDIAAYGALVVAALGQLAAGRRRRDGEAWADTTSLLLAAGLLVLAFSDGVGGQFSEKGVGAPLFTALVLVVCIPLAMPDNGRSVSALALLAAGALTAVGYGGPFLSGVFADLPFVGELPQLAVAGLVLAGRHPSVARLGLPAASAQQVTTGRLLGLCAALLISPVLLLLVGVRDGGVGYVLAAGSTLLTTVALWRLASMNRQREGARAAAAASEARLQLLLDNAADVIAIVDGRGAITYISPAVESLLGRPPAEYVGRHAIALADPRDQPRLRAAVAAAGEAGSMGAGFVDTDIRVQHSSGGTRWVEVRISGRIDAVGVEGWVVNFREVTDRKLFEEELRRQATTDPLTGLLNRTAFSDRLAAATATIDPAAPPAVLFVDIDDFKTVNDTLGHAAGDELLVTVAARLTADVRADDVVARLGGDEFAVLLAEADGDRLRDVADRLLAAVRAPMELTGTTVSVTASIGGSLGAPGDTAERLLHSADTAMYGAKRGGKDARTLLDGLPRQRG